jgi:hypothetical protein
VKNLIGSEDSVSIRTESSDHILKTLELMLKIEELAQARLNEILVDVRAGKTTLDEVKRQRGLI